MKKILVCVSLLFCFAYLNANDHITFCGVDVYGDPVAFKQQLIDKGFESEKGLPLMGEFLGEEVMVAFLQKTDSNTSSECIVGVVAIEFPSHNWDTIETKYRNCVDRVTKEYGSPTEVIWDVADGKDPKRELVKERATIYTKFEKNNGEIVVEIKKMPLLGMTVFITIVDKENMAK